MKTDDFVGLWNLSESRSYELSSHTEYRDQKKKNPTQKSQTGQKAHVFETEEMTSYIYIYSYNNLRLFIEGLNFI